MELWLVLPLGLALGMLLGALGGGGSILAVPLLVYILGEPVKAATTESLLIVGAAALVGAIEYGRAGRVRLKTALVYGSTAVCGSFVGTALNRFVADELIMVAFALLLFAAAILMFRRRPVERPSPPEASLWLALPAGIGTGALTGFFGVGGGFLVVPVLVLVFGLPLSLAVGTSLAVIAMTSASALAFHAATGIAHWGIAAVFMAAAAAGTLTGRRVADRADPRRLSQAFAVLLAGTASALMVVNIGPSL
jgi:uncharacterized membrane protein YfcA